MRTKGRPCENNQNFEEYVRIIFITLTVCGTVITILGNTLVCLAVYKTATLRTPSNYLLVSLSLASLMFVPIYISHTIFLLNTNCQVKLKHLCEWSSSLNFILICVVILHLLLISLDRLVAVKMPMRYPCFVTTKRMLIAIALLWIAGTLEGVIPKFFQVQRRERSKDVLQLLHGCLVKGVPSTKRLKPVMPEFVTLLTLAIILPCAVMLVTQGWIFHVSIKQYRRIRALEESMSTRYKTEMKAAKTMAVIVLYSLACVVPLVAVTFTMAFARSAKRQLVSEVNVAFIVLPSLKIMNLSATSLYPLIYAMKIATFRRAFQSVLQPLKRCFCKKTAHETHRGEVSKESGVVESEV